MDRRLSSTKHFFAMEFKFLSPCSLFQLFLFFTVVSSFEDTLKHIGSHHLRMGETWNSHIIMNRQVFKSHLYCTNTIQDAAYAIFWFSTVVSSKKYGKTGLKWKLVFSISLHSQQGEMNIYCGWFSAHRGTSLHFLYCKSRGL